jgi:hypothetical protein
VPAKNNATRDFSRSGRNISAMNNIQNLLSVHQILFFISSLLSKLNRIKCEELLEIDATQVSTPELAV